MNLGWVEEGAEIVDEDRGVILHEFGHTLGLNHEHQSPARGGKLQLKEAGEFIECVGNILRVTYLCSQKSSVSLAVLPTTGHPMLSVNRSLTYTTNEISATTLRLILTQS